MTEREGRGLVHVLTGPGKGKTTAAFGLAMRAAGHGLKVCIVQFMKTGATTGEVISAEKHPNVSVAQFGTGKFIGPKGPGRQDRACAKKALDHTRSILSEGQCQLLVLDEVNVAVKLGLLSTSEVLDVLRSRPAGVEIVLTGRDAPKEFIEVADYVSEVRNVKHPFEAGKKARKGIEW